MLTERSLTVIEGDARVACRHLSEVLGYNRVNDLHRLIENKREELEDFGGIFLREEKNPSAKGGRPTKSYFLNEHQATAICMWAETAKAREARRLIIEVFTRWRHGEPLPPATVDPFRAQRERVSDVSQTIEQLSNLTGIAAEVTYLPIWGNGRRPNWWANVEMRQFLTDSHRQVFLKQAVAEAKRRWPDWPVSTAALQRYWARLDEVRGVTPPVQKLRLISVNRRTDE